MKEDEISESEDEQSQMQPSASLPGVEVAGSKDMPVLGMMLKGEKGSSACAVAVV